MTSCRSAASRASWRLISGSSGADSRKRQQRAARGVVVSVECQRPSQGEHVAFVVSVSDRGASKRVGGIVDLPGLDLLLPAPIPFGGIAEAGVAIARRDRPRHEERGNGHEDQDPELENLAMDESGPLDGVAWWGDWQGSNDLAHVVSTPKSQGSTHRLLVETFWR